MSFPIHLIYYAQSLLLNFLSLILSALVFSYRTRLQYISKFSCVVVVVVSVVVVVVRLQQKVSVDSLLPAELKTKEEGGLVPVRRSLSLTGPHSKKLHVVSFISFVFLVFNWQQFCDKKLVICSVPYISLLLCLVVPASEF